MKLRLLVLSLALMNSIICNARPLPLPTMRSVLHVQEGNSEAIAFPCPWGAPTTSHNVSNVQVVAGYCTFYNRQSGYDGVAKINQPAVALSLTNATKCGWTSDPPAFGAIYFISDDVFYSGHVPSDNCGTPEAPFLIAHKPLSLLPSVIRLLDSNRCINSWMWNDTNVVVLHDDGPRETC